MGRLYPVISAGIQRTEVDEYYDEKLNIIAQSVRPTYV